MNLNEYITDNNDLKIAEIGEQTVCYIFMKQPQEPKI